MEEAGWRDAGVAGGRPARERDAVDVGGSTGGVNEDHVLEGAGEVRGHREGCVVDEGEAAARARGERGDRLGAAAVTGDQRGAAVEAGEAGGAVGERRPPRGVRGDREHPRAARDELRDRCGR
jgi:hypothetical protein